MRLFITEKPSFAKTICKAIGRPISDHNGYVQCGEDIITWCQGHLLELADPEHYDPRFARWDISTLPLFPAKWEWVPQKKNLHQLRVVADLAQGASVIVHAGAPDREGQLLIDSVLRYIEINPHPEADVAEPAVKRLLLFSLTPESVRHQLTQLIDNRVFKTLCFSAIARLKSDWLYGINLSRLLTLLSRAKGETGVFTIGRVQTPILGLIVKRDKAIRKFKPAVTVQLLGMLKWPEKETLADVTVCWQPPAPVTKKATAPGLADSSLSYKSVADTLESIYGKHGQIIEVKVGEEQQHPPLPFDLSSLQIAAASTYGINASETQRLAQELYEKHHLISFPRAESRLLPEHMHSETVEVMQVIAQNLPRLTAYCNQTDWGMRSPAWQTQKIAQAHGIVPTQHRYHGSLSEACEKIYGLICERFLLQFFPPRQTRTLTCMIRIEQLLFAADIRCLADAGWSRTDKASCPQEDDKRITWVDSAQFDALDSELNRLAVIKDSHINLWDWQITTDTSLPPLPFDDASLIKAMSGIRAYVEDPLLARTLRDSDGFGTESTRAHIIEMLYQREYITRNAQTISATAKGHQLINLLPPSMSAPDLTASWEARINTIRSGTETSEHFVTAIKEDIGRLMTAVISNFNEQLVAESRGGDSSALAKTTTVPQMPAITHVPHCPECDGKTTLCLGKFGVFWSCQKYPACTGKRPFKDLFPPVKMEKPAHDKAKTKPPKDQIPKGEVAIPCPECYAPLQRRTSQYGVFWGCSNFPKCQCKMGEKDGKPDLGAYLFGRK